SDAIGTNRTSRRTRTTHRLIGPPAAPSRRHPLVARRLRVLELHRLDEVRRVIPGDGEPDIMAKQIAHLPRQYHTLPGPRDDLPGVVPPGDDLAERIHPCDRG